MTGLTKNHRLHHIFRDNGRTFIVALDHATVYGASEGMERPGEVIRQIRQGGADAILTSYGIAKQFVDEIGDLGLILRVDGGLSSLVEDRGPFHLVYQAEDALRLGADGVGAMGMPGSRYESQTLPYLSALVGQCAQWNLPVVAEMLPGGFEDPARMWTPANIAIACRIGAEMGVDFVKTAYTGDVESFARIIDQVPVPLVILGGSKAGDPRDLLQNIHGAMQAGASGVACGRNIFQHEQPAKIAAAVAAIIHEGATVDAALALLA